MNGRFHKMHGLGNDFVVLDARAEPVAMSARRARAMADRRTGIGCDQLIVLDASPDRDAAMTIWNSDGSPAEACGNAFRAVALLMGDAVLATSGGDVTIAAEGGVATVDLQPPRFGWDEIPLAYAVDTTAMPVAWGDLSNPVAVNVGNPHVIFFVADNAAIDIEALGPQVETDALFPDRINVNVATVMGPGGLSLRTWERGAGLTLACGTGACATAVAAIRSKRVSSPVSVTMTGGTVEIDWAEGRGIRMTGPATHVYSGEFDWDAFPL
ncbi:MAG: diaminopimelate epimerase [Sphingomonadales bacterium]